MEACGADSLKQLARPSSVTAAEARVKVSERKLRARAFIFVVGLLSLGLSRTQCLLNIAEVETDQPIGQQDGGDAPGAPESVDRRFAYLQHVS